MTDYLLTIVITNHNTSDFTLNSLYCLKKLTKNHYKVIIRDNDSKLKDYLKLKKYIKYFQNVHLYRVENLNIPDELASLAHGLALNDLIKKIDTKYGVILDSDCVFLHKNWDEILINELNEKCPIIGTQAPPFKYQDFPFVFGMLFNTEVMKSLNVDFRPKSIINNRLDTGYEVRNKFLLKGYNGKLLINKYTETFKSGPFRNILCQEFYLTNYEKIFASHFWRGHTIGVGKYYESFIREINKIPILGSFVVLYLVKTRFSLILARLIGLIEKNKWIRICRKIVELNS